MLSQETPTETAAHLLSMIESSQQMIKTLDKLAQKYPALTAEYAKTIAEEKNLIKLFTHQLQEMF